MIQDIADWLEEHQIACMYKKLLGVECPACGMQRAFIELLRGNLAESLSIFPALLPLLFSFAFLVLHLIFNFKKGAMVLKISIIATASIMLINYFIKIIFVYHGESI